MTGFELQPSDQESGTPLLRPVLQFLPAVVQPAPAYLSAERPRDCGRPGHGLGQGPAP